MNFQDYQHLFEAILSGENQQPPYDDEEKRHYTKLNSSRLHRWLKTGVITTEAKEAISNIRQPQQWVLITEPWCGDAAHSVPFIYLLSALSDKVKLEIQLRDSGSEIDKYLTNGSMAIPILVVRDDEGKDLFTWGPRPQLAQDLFLSEKAKGTSAEDNKLKLQQWYNEDKGQAIQQELSALLQQH